MLKLIAIKLLIAIEITIYVGSAARTCPRGFLFEEEYGSCVDVNECSVSDICPDGHFCRNVIGSFECIGRERFVATLVHQCPDGERFNGGQCVDIDECVEFPGICDDDNEVSLLIAEC